MTESSGLLIGFHNFTHLITFVWKVFSLRFRHVKDHKPQNKVHQAPHAGWQPGGFQRGSDGEVLLRALWHGRPRELLLLRPRLRVRAHQQRTGQTWRHGIKQLYNRFYLADFSINNLYHEIYSNFVGNNLSRHIWTSRN